MKLVEQPVLEEVFVLKIRIKFSKLGLMKFIGHLDFMRAWQKVFRRSEIPIAYSEGFHPHQIFSIGAPLGVGTTGDGEYLDLKLTVETYDLEKLVKELNACVPEDILVTGAVELKDKEIAAMAACKAASYCITCSKALTEFIDSDKLKTFFEQDSIVVEKKTKKGKLKELELKEGIYEYEYEAGCLTVILATGSSYNIKPDLLMNAILDDMGLIEELRREEHYYSVHRNETYREINPYKNLIELD